ncbi:MAG TPA: SulP family inorganic anion transporter [Pseudomonadales bacterium]|nr:SulP family inorganic anion transporter [Pseudomonadales bacterium]
MLQWARNYRRDQLAGDLGAGAIVALMLIPQGMAYALLAGLPPAAGLYASILPPVAYALFGSSMTQSVGPMAITSLMSAAALSALAPAGSVLYVTLATQLALLTGLVLLACGALRLGFLSGFLSRPVLAGFTAGAAILIAVGQLPLLLTDAAAHPDVPTALIGGVSLALLWLAKGPLLRRTGEGSPWPVLLRLVPAAVIGAATLAAWILELDRSGVRVLGSIPRGLPPLGLQYSGAHWQSLLAPALLIGFVVFVSSQSAAQSLAQRRGERVLPDGELLGLGAANVAGALSGGFPVTGSISRSAVNDAAGANTPLASLVSAGLLAAVLSLPTGWLAPLPLAALAATIIVAVAGMIDIAALKEAWRYDRADAMAMIVTAAGVLALGVERGVIIGVVVSLGALIARASRPNIAVVGRAPGSDFFRNVGRHEVETLPEVLMLRIDAAIWFGNTDAILGRVELELASRPATRHVVLVMSAVNHIDVTGVLMLRELNLSLAGRNILLHLAKTKESVMDRLASSQLPAELRGRMFASPGQAFRALECGASGG